MQSRVIKFKPYGVVRRHTYFKAAAEIVFKLKKAGFEAYFVGGCVRDLLLRPNILPKDIDIASSASSEQVKRIFPCIHFVGQCFEVCLVKWKGYTFELAMFRKEGIYLDSRRPSQVSEATIYEDSCRRDFTVNAFYFDPHRRIILDFHSGFIDLKNKMVRCVGNPSARFSEDVLRMLRALRFSVEYNFKIEFFTNKELVKNWEKISFLPKERILLELQKCSRLSLLVCLFKSLFIHPFVLFQGAVKVLKRDFSVILHRVNLPKIKSKDLPLFLFLFHSIKFFLPEKSEDLMNHIHIWPLLKEDKKLSEFLLKVFSLSELIQQKIFLIEQQKQIIYFLFLNLCKISSSAAHWVVAMLCEEIRSRDENFFIPIPLPCNIQLDSKEGEIFRAQVEEIEGFGIRYVQYSIALYLFDRNIEKKNISSDGYVQKEIERIKTFYKCYETISCVL